MDFLEPIDINEIREVVSPFTFETILGTENKKAVLRSKIDYMADDIAYIKDKINALNEQIDSDIAKIKLKITALANTVKTTTADLIGRNDVLLAKIERNDQKIEKIIEFLGILVRYTNSKVVEKFCLL